MVKKIIYTFIYLYIYLYCTLCMYTNIYIFNVIDDPEHKVHKFATRNCT